MDLFHIGTKNLAWFLTALFLMACNKGGVEQSIEQLSDTAGLRDSLPQPDESSISADIIPESGEVVVPEKLIPPPYTFQESDGGLTLLYGGAWDLRNGIGFNMGQEVSCEVEFKSPSHNFLLKWVLGQNTLSLNIIRIDCINTEGDSMDVISAPFWFEIENGLIVDNWSEGDFEDPDSWVNYRALAGAIDENSFRYKNCHRWLSQVKGQCFEMDLIRSQNPDLMGLRLVLPLNNGQLFEIEAQLIRSDYPGYNP